MFLPRILFRKYFVLSVLLTLILFILIGSSSSTSANPSKNNSNNADDTPSAGQNIQNLIAGKEANIKLWEAFTKEDSLGGKVYDYLFKGDIVKDTSPSSTTSTSSSEPFTSTTTTTSKDSNIKLHQSKTDDSLDFKDFIYDLFSKVYEFEPKATPNLKKFYKTDENGEIIKIKTSGMDDKFNPEKQMFSINFLKSIINIPDEYVSELKKLHTGFLNYLLSSLKLPKNFYEKNSSGIVYVGGGKFTWFALLSIKNIRKVGGKLPIELFIPTEDEYEYVICEEILPKLNAKCVLMYDYLKDDDKHDIFTKMGSFKGFTYKSLALLLSSFENILLLDADNVPYYNPDILFINDPYKTYNFVVWPDYWQRSTSPFFYDIANIDLKKLNPHTYDEDSISLHDLNGTIPNPSTESGQLMISKSKHWDILLLSLYYNIYGPNHYYHLFSQGAAGQGDKETFMAAATVLNSEYYQVTSKVSAIGYFKSGEYRGTAQGQKSPIEDFELKKSAKILKDYYINNGIFDDLTNNSNSNSDNNDEDVEEILPIIKKFVKDENSLSDSEFELLFKYNNLPNPRVFFIHESTPKLDPIQLIKENQFWGDDNKRIRFYSNYITGSPAFYKFEKLQIEYIYEFLCEKKMIIRFIEEQISDLYLKNDKEFKTKEFCGELRQQIQWLDDQK